MSIEGLTTKEKSVMLIKARGEAWYTPIDLYAPINMSVAWLFLNWALSTAPFRERVSMTHYNVKDYELSCSLYGLMTVPAPKAQASWLDRILELSIEAGLVKVDEVKE